MEKQVIIYRVDSTDNIVYTNSQWDQFAMDNGGEAILSENIINHSLWDFISDRTTMEIYHQALKKVRTGHALSFSLRCDGPNCQRKLNMQLQVGPDNTVEFSTQLVSQINTSALADFTSHHTDEEQFIRSCSWCNKIYVQDQWLELEQAINEMNYLEQNSLPLFTHSICPACEAKMMNIVD